MENLRVNAKGQIVIPEWLRNKYGFTNGISVLFEETSNGILLKPMDEQYFKSFAGILKNTGHLKEEMRQMKEEEKALEERKLKLL